MTLQVDKRTGKAFHETFTMRQVLEKSVFQIPAYQRGYSWEKSHRTDLLDDLEQLLISPDKTHRHYMGTIVAAKKSSGSSKLNKYEVVDGQQRITTILILLSAIKLYQINNKKVELFKLVFDRDFSDQILQPDWDENTVIRDILRIRGTNNKIADRPYTNNSEKNAIDAWREFNSWCKKRREQLPNFLDIILDRLGFIFFTPKHTKTLGIMFEVINNRGKQLSQLDKIKNYMLYYASVNEDELKSLSGKISECWGNILSNLSIAGLTAGWQEDNVVADCYFMFSRIGLKSRSNVYELLKKEYPIGENTTDKLAALHSFVEMLDASADTLKRLYTAKSFASRQHDSKGFVMEHLRFHSSRAVINPLLTVFDIAHNHQCITDDQHQQLMSTLEIANFRLHELPSPKTRSDSFLGTILTEARKFFHSHTPYHHLNKVHEQHDVESFINWFEEYTVYHRPIKDFVVSSLTLDIGEPYDYYRWNACRYFLASYEQAKRFAQHDSKQDFPLENILGGDRREKHSGAFERTQIDHIWATENAWGVDQTNENGKFQHQIRRLGNFVLLKESENKRVKNTDVEVKLMYLSLLHPAEFRYNRKSNEIEVRIKKQGKRLIAHNLVLSNDEKDKKLTEKLLNDQTSSMSDWKSLTETARLLGEAIEYHPTGRKRHQNRRLMIYTRLFDLREELLVNWAIDRWSFDIEKEGIPSHVGINSFSGTGASATLITKFGEKLYTGV